MAAGRPGGQPGPERRPSHGTVLIESLPSARISVACGIDCRQCEVVQIRSLPELMVRISLVGSIVAVHSPRTALSRTVRLRMPPGATARLDGATLMRTSLPPHLASSAGSDWPGDGLRDGSEAVEMLVEAGAEGVTEADGEGVPGAGL